MRRNVFMSTGSLPILGADDVIRPNHLASFLRIDPNQIRSVLEMFAAKGVLSPAGIIECLHCRMGPQSDYEEAMSEEDERQRFGNLFKTA